MIKNLKLILRYTGPGSTPNLKDIILGRCAEYLLIKAHGDLVNGPLNCNKIWQTFQAAFAFKDPCKPGSYKSFVDMTAGPPIKDKVRSVVT